MTRRISSVLAAILVTASTVGVFGLVAPGNDRPDCPGEIVCPLTGDLVCKDRCPLGESHTTKQAAQLPSCCRASD